LAVIIMRLPVHSGRRCWRRALPDISFMAELLVDSDRCRL